MNNREIAQPVYENHSLLSAQLAVLSNCLEKFRLDYWNLKNLYSSKASSKFDEQQILENKCIAQIKEICDYHTPLITVAMNLLKPNLSTMCFDQLANAHRKLVEVQNIYRRSVYVYDTAINTPLKDLSVWILKFQNVILERHFMQRQKQTSSTAAIQDKPSTTTPHAISKSPSPVFFQQPTFHPDTQIIDDPSKATSSISLT